MASNADYTPADDDNLSAAFQTAYDLGRSTCHGSVQDQLDAEDARAREHMTSIGAYPAGEDDEL